MKIVTNKKDSRVPFRRLSAGDTFIFKNSFCMKVLIPKHTLGLSEDNACLFGCYINLETNNIGPINPDDKVEIVNASIILDDWEETAYDESINRLLELHS